MHYGSTGNQQPAQGFPAAQAEGEESGLVYSGQKKYGVRSSSVSVKPPPQGTEEGVVVERRKGSEDGEKKRGKKGGLLKDFFQDKSTLPRKPKPGLIERSHYVFFPKPHAFSSAKVGSVSYRQVTPTKAGDGENGGGTGVPSVSSTTAAGARAFNVFSL